MNVAEKLAFKDVISSGDQIIERVDNVPADVDSLSGDGEGEWQRRSFSEASSFPSSLC